MTYLERIIDYNNWANLGLLRFLDGQPATTLDLTTSGVYGSIRSTLEHLLSSELGYHRRLRTPAAPRPERPIDPDLELLHEMADHSAELLTALLRSLPDPDRMIELDDGPRAAATILTQLVMHGTEHRTHIGTILGAHGIEPPDLDSWAHGIWSHGDAWPADWGPEPPGR